MRALLLLAGLGLLVTACQSGAAIGTTCSRNTECASPLVCRIGRCRTECVVGRDCPAGQACLINADGQGACELPSVDVCSVSCDAPLICAVGHCRVQCVRDAECPGGHVCASSACQRSEGATDAGSSEPDANHPDAGDAGLFCDPVADTGCSGRCGLAGGVPACVVGGGTGIVGTLCSTESECSAGHSCQGGRCQRVCSLAEVGGCGSGHFCSTDSVHGQTPMTSDNGIGLCSETCTLLPDTGCIMGGSCAFQVGSGQDYTWCRDAVESATEGAACPHGAYECAAGLSCHTGTCRRTCTASGGQCSGSDTCVIVTALQGGVGECTPP